MDATASTPAFDLLKQIPGDLLRLDSIPLLGFSPSFPLEAVSAQLARTFQIEGLKLESSTPHWRSKDELFEGLGDNRQIITLSVAPLAGKAYWVMTDHDLSKIMAALLVKNGSTVQIDPDFKKAFTYFLAIETLNAIEKSDFDKKLSYSFTIDDSVPSEPALAIDVTLSLPENAVSGRLLITPELRSSWQKRYLEPPKEFYKTSPLAEKIQVIIQLEAGRTKLSMSEWKNVNLGDFIILDSCSLEAGEDKGRIMLTVNGFPFFRGRVKQGSIKILEHPLYHEVDTAMNKTPGDDEDFDSDFDDEDFDSDFDETTEESSIEESSMEESEIEPDLDSDLDSDFESEIEEEPKKPTQPPQKPAAPQAAAAPQKPSAQPTPAPQTPAQGTVQAKQPASAAALKPVDKGASPATPSVEDIPLQIVVEVGRLQMSVKQLMELQPGNMLELDIHPESGVDLVVNGHRIAKGELLKIGEALGVRILEIT